MRAFRNAGLLGGGADDNVPPERAHQTVALRIMDRARKLWEKLGLPHLEPESPWYGYTLGDWSPELDREASLAALGDYWQTGAKSAEERRSTQEIPPNTSYYAKQK